MGKSYSRLVALLLISSTLFSSCSMLSESRRRESAYERYVRKSSLERVELQRRLRKEKATIPPMEPSAPVESSGPEAVSVSSL